jgi:hypothetical protein
VVGGKCHRRVQSRGPALLEEEYNLFQFLEEPSLVTERNGVIVDDLAVPFKKELADGKGASTDARTTTAAESTKEG